MQRLITAKAVLKVIGDSFSLAKANNIVTKLNKLCLILKKEANFLVTCLDET